MKTFNQLSIDSDSQLVKLTRKAGELHHLEKIFYSVIDAELIPHCHLAKLSKDTLTVTVSNAAWGTRLRYQAPEIIKCLNVHPEFSTIQKIRYLIKLNSETETPKKTHKNKISAENEAIWQELIKSLVGAKAPRTK
jgi:hypothetical protein